MSSSLVLLGPSVVIRIAGTIFACTITVANMNVTRQPYVGDRQFHATDVATFYDVRNMLFEI